MPPGLFAGNSGPMGTIRTTCARFRTYFGALCILTVPLFEQKEGWNVVVLAQSSEFFDERLNAESGNL